MNEIPPQPDPLQLAERLRKLVIPDADAVARRERGPERDRVARALLCWDQSNAPKRHSDRAKHPGLIDLGSPWGRTRQAVLEMMGRGVILCLTGTRGTGKTQIAVDAIARVTGDGKAALFRTARELFLRIRTSYHADSRRTELDLIAEHRRPSLLVIDEIGRRSDTAFENDTLFELLNQRYNDMLDTIVTCNLAAAEAHESLGASIVDRMREGGGIVECNWPSFRQ